MATIACKYHPEAPARWRCRHCAINFCPGCVPAPASGPAQGRPPSCPVCSKALDSLGTGNAVAPFWRRLGHCFAYPLYPAPFIVILVLTLLGMAVHGVFMGPLLELALWAVTMKYAYVVLEDVAHGHLRPRPITGEAIATGLELPFKQILLLMAIGAADTAVLRLLGPSAFALAFFFSTLALPANIMVLVLERSFFKAFDPATVLTVIKRIGLPYLLLWFVLMSVGGGSAAAVHFAMQWLPGTVGLAVGDLLAMYFLLVMFATMGYVLYQYHEELGYEVEEPQAPGAAPAAAPVSPELRQAEILIQEGKTEEALARLAQLVRGSPADDAARERHLRLLRAVDDKDGHCRACQDYISYLFCQERHAQALKALAGCRRYDPTVKPAGAKERLELAKLLKAEGQGRAAMALLSNLHQDHPGFSGTPEAYLLVAQLMCEQFGEDAKALQVLRFLVKQFPEHPLQEEVGKYLQLVEGMAAG